MYNIKVLLFYFYKEYIIKIICIYKISLLFLFEKNFLDYAFIFFYNILCKNFFVFIKFKFYKKTMVLRFIIIRISDSEIQKVLCIFICLISFWIESFILSFVFLVKHKLYLLYPPCFNLKIYYPFHLSDFIHSYKIGNFLFQNHAFFNKIFFIFQYFIRHFSMFYSIFQYFCNYFLNSELIFLFLATVYIIFLFLDTIF